MRVPFPYLVSATTVTMGVLLAVKSAAMAGLMTAGGAVLPAAAASEPVSKPPGAPVHPPMAGVASPPANLCDRDAACRSAPSDPPPPVAPHATASVSPPSGHEDLEARAAAMSAVEAALHARLADLKSQQRALAHRHEDETRQAGAERDRLTQIYEAMEPPRAAEILNAMEVSLAATLLERMSPRKAAAIMAQMNPVRVIVLTQRLASSAAGGRG